MSISILTGRQIYIEGCLQPATLEISDGKICKIHKGTHVKKQEAYPQVPAENFYDAQDLIVMPGIIDAHVHINEPGRTKWEGFETATLAAASGSLLSANCQVESQLWWICHLTPSLQLRQWKTFT